MTNELASIKMIRSANKITKREQNERFGDSIRLLHWAVLAWFSLVLALGGASQNAPFRDLFVQLATGLVVLVIAWHGKRPHLEQGSIALFALGGLGLVLIGWQLVPLPEAVISLVSGRSIFLNELHAAGIPSRFEVTSLAPFLTLRSMMYALVWAMMLWVALSISTNLHRHMILVFVASSWACVLVAALQLSYSEISTVQRSVTSAGFYSNRNHYAAMLVCAIPLAFYWYKSRPMAARRATHAKVVERVVVVATVALSIGGIAISGSRAGFVLLMLGLALTAAVMLQSSDHPKKLQFAGAGTFVAGLIAVVLWQTGGIDAIDRLLMTDKTDGRLLLWEQVGAAIPVYWPWGSGGDSLQRVMLVHEFSAAIDSTFINRAHNEYLGVALEHGLPGVVWLALTVVVIATGYVLRVIECCRDNLAKVDQPKPASTARMSAGAVPTTTVTTYSLLLLPLVLLALHSFVDYPMRTPALGLLSVLLVAMIVGGPRELETGPDS